MKRVAKMTPKCHSTDMKAGHGGYIRMPDLEVRTRKDFIAMVAGLAYAAVAWKWIMPWMFLKLGAGV